MNINPDVCVDENVRVLDDIPARNSESLRPYIYTQKEKKQDALSLIWDIMDSYIQSNCIAAWIPKASQYFNQVMKLEHRI